MIILSHRGSWQSPEEKNGFAAFHRTVAEGFGTETDFRDMDGKLVISHDPATAEAPLATDVVELFAGKALTLAVNVKADGISELLASLFRTFEVPWFAFDMSGPETLRYAKAGLPFMTRHSDIEPEPILYDYALGVWLDSFGAEWFGSDVIDTHLRSGKQVCIVSSELHGRDPRRLWDKLEAMKDREGLMLCTDIPLDARKRFGS